MKTSKVILFSAFTFLFSGCLLQEPYIPTKLQTEAKGVMIAKNTPYNCIVLGEMEGRSDTKVGAIGANLETLRNSAINDLKNNTYHATGDNKRIMIKITEQEATCIYHGQVRDCTDRETGNIRSYRVAAQIFECGNR